MLNGRTLRFCSAINDALPRDIPDDIIDGWNSNPTALKVALATVLLPTELVIQHIIVEKTIMLGNGLRTLDHFRNAYSKQRMALSEPAKELLESPDFKVSLSPTEIDLAFIPLRLLGFKQSPTRKEIISRALEKGYELCPAEVGPQLRWQYPDQPIGDLVIAMIPLYRRADSSSPRVFSVENMKSADAQEDRTLWLSIDGGYDNYTWNIDKRFVFVKPRE